MDEKQYKALTKRPLPKRKPRTLPLPKGTKKYLEFEEDLIERLEILDVKYVRNFQIKNTKHGRFDLLLIEYDCLIEIAGGPWSGWRQGKLKNKAWSVDRYEVAKSLGYHVLRVETADRWMHRDIGPYQISKYWFWEWVRKLKRHVQDGTNKTIPTDFFH